MLECAHGFARSYPHPTASPGSCAHVSLQPINPIEKAVYTKAGVKYRGVLREFVVTEDAMLPVGFPLTVRHFMPGQCVDITSKSYAAC